jgi:hypothetical protein
VALALGLLILATPALGQDRPRRRPGGEGGRPGGRPTGGSDEKGNEKKGGVQPYDEVIPEDAETDPGLFLVHRVKDKLFYEIPAARLGKEMLWVTQIAQTQAGYGYGGTPALTRVVRWELREKDEKVLLRDVKYQIRADVDDPIRTAFEATSLEPILQVFDVNAWGKD